MLNSFEVGKSKPHIKGGQMVINPYLVYPGLATDLKSLKSSSAVQFSPKLILTKTAKCIRSLISVYGLSLILLP